MLSVLPLAGGTECIENSSKRHLQPGSPGSPGQAELVWRETPGDQFTFEFLFKGRPRETPGDQFTFEFLFKGRPRQTSGERFTFEFLFKGGPRQTSGERFTFEFLFKGRIPPLNRNSKVEFHL